MGSSIRRPQLGGNLIPLGGSLLERRSEQLGKPTLAKLSSNLDELAANPLSRIEPIRAGEVQHAEGGGLLQVVGEIDDDQPPLVLGAKGQCASGFRDCPRPDPYAVELGDKVLDSLPNRLADQAATKTCRSAGTTVAEIAVAVDVVEQARRDDLCRLVEL